MASVFGHVMASSALGMSFFKKQLRSGTFWLTAFCAFAPDLDVLTFYLGIPYSSQWGHRGWTHSLVFAVAFGWLMAWLFYRRHSDFQRIIWWCILATASHPLLDMMTDGGRGCALWWPFDASRIFLPWRPIAVSPLGISDFFTPWGLEVLYSEVLYIGFPALAIIVLFRMIRLNPIKSE
ncbi:MAG: metal-dependent hydrolase [Saprospiraceae bacterium]|nr:metal-dependent hydrolase [Saprospiraceae bacterium]